MLSARRTDDRHLHYFNEERMQTLSGRAAQAMEAVQQVGTESGTGEFT